MTSRTPGGEEILSAIPDTIGAIGPDLHGLSCGGRVEATSFLIEGESASVSGNQQGAAPSVSIAGSVVLTNLEVELGRAVNLLLFPGIARREWAGPTGTSVETLLVAPALPLVAIQWSAAVGSAPGSVSFVLEPRFDDGVVRTEEAGVSITGDTGRVLAAAFSPNPERLDVREEEGQVHIVAKLRDSPLLTLLVAGGETDRVRAALRAAGHLSGHAIRAADGPVEGGLRLLTGVPEIDEGVAWARARLHGAIAREASASPRSAGSSAAARSALPLGLAAIATGDRAGATRTITAMAPVTTAVGALLSARFASTFGDTTHASEAAGSWLARDGGTPADADSLLSIAARSLADGLQHAAPADVLTKLRALATGSDPGPGGRRLPMVRSERGQPTPDDWLAPLLAGAPTPPFPSAASGLVDRARQATSTFMADPDQAWIGWREVLTMGVDGPEGPYTWDSLAHDSPDSAVAELLLGLTQGLLGLDPDAPVGRLRLAPRLPSHLVRFAVEGIPAGDSVIRLGFDRSESTLRYVVEPQAGSVPPLVVFEPMVPGVVRSVRIDGVEAELDTRRLGLHTVVLVQLALDAPRNVEIQVESVPE